MVSNGKTIAATPNKRFFIDMLTRDITTTEAILDLVDNAVDKAVEVAEYDVMDVLLGERDADVLSQFKITVTGTENSFSIRDNSGGITPEEARSEVFLFGNPAEGTRGAGLSAYGIGMKRAVFKLGSEMVLESRTPHANIKVPLDVQAWSARPDDWTLEFDRDTKFEMDQMPPYGTNILIARLHHDIASRFSDPTFWSALVDALSWSYALFLSAGMQIQVNDVAVMGSLPRLASQTITPGRYIFKYGDVDILIVVGVAPRTDQAAHGWYVFCNGRMVLRADKTSVTGWGDGLPQFHSGKHRRFVGFVYFRSSDVSALPWRTTKQGVDSDSAVFRAALNEMRVQAKPVLSFLNDLYPSEVSSDAVVERDVLNQAGSTSIEAAAKTNATFSYVRPKRTKSATVSIQYRRPRELIDRIKRHLGDQGMPASRVGELTFDHYIDEVS